MQKATNELRIIEEKEAGMLKFQEKLKVVENFMRLFYKLKKLMKRKFTSFKTQSD